MGKPWSHSPTVGQFTNIIIIIVIIIIIIMACVVNLTGAAAFFYFSGSLVACDRAALH
jgi:hypothetical protein